MNIQRVPRWRTITWVSAFVVGAVAAPAAAMVAAAVGGQPHAGHGHELAVQRSLPQGRTDVIKVM